MSENTPKKVLVAEDDVAVAEIYKNRIEALGFEVVSAHDGEEVISLAKTESPDLILLELTLPKKSGFEVLKELRGDDSFSKIPIFIISDDGEDEDIRKALEMGASLFFTKSKSRLIDIIQNIEGVLTK